ncbi:hypothetical protein BOW37_12805 [Solemya velum gill symbiont]|uniref:hypothetical protein n=1 Tax=Solemya velum gill symbiont TaxID=2340 RepID=UPI000997B9A0|nr:hypothetical protein [Solemya velum gill symbiont]OOZ42624.1 hypothetical protein BOW37_12805 [Solemya velum gill symbiont]
MWKRHFADMAAGKLKLDDKGYYHVATIQTGGSGFKLTIKIVTPTAQAVEIAKSELTDKREDLKNNPTSQKRKSPNIGYKSKTEPRVYKRKHTPKKTKTKEGKILKISVGNHIWNTK